MHVCEDTGVRWHLREKSLRTVQLVTRVINQSFD